MDVLCTMNYDNTHAWSATSLGLQKRVYFDTFMICVAGLQHCAWRFYPESASKSIPLLQLQVSIRVPNAICQFTTIKIQQMASWRNMGLGIERGTFWIQTGVTHWSGMASLSGTTAVLTSCPLDMLPSNEYGMRALQYTRLKIKFSLEQAMKAQRGSRDIVLLFL